MVTRWIGKQFQLVGGDRVTVRAASMSQTRLVVLDLEGNAGRFNLTARELELNLEGNK